MEKVCVLATVGSEEGGTHPPSFEIFPSSEKRGRRYCQMTGGQHLMENYYFPHTIFTEEEPQGERKVLGAPKERQRES